MSRERPGHLRWPQRFPRVSGDEPAYNLDNSYEVTFSPRERG